MAIRRSHDDNESLLALEDLFPCHHQCIHGTEILTPFFHLGWLYQKQLFQKECLIELIFFDLSSASPCVAFLTFNS